MCADCIEFDEFDCENKEDLIDWDGDYIMLLAV
jgi:hypothetical protein